MKEISRIICPVDFSPAANNAIEYAAKLAQKLKGEMVLLHVKPISATDSVLPGVIAKSIKSIGVRLQKICDEIYATYHVTSSFMIEVGESLSSVINSKSKENNIVVMGSNGTDDLYQYMFGTNALKIIKKSKCPVLIIPENVTFKNIERIVFAWDYSRHNRRSFLQLKDFLETFDPQIIFLHVSKRKTAISDDIYQAIKDETISYFGRNDKTTYSRLYLDDDETIPQKLNAYMLKANIDTDLLAITVYDRGIFQNIFHGDVAAYLSESATYPLLALH